MKSYLKLAMKVLARRKFFTFISLFGIVLTLTVLVIGAAILDNFFAPRKPESRFERVLCVYQIGQYGREGGMTTSPGYAFVERYVDTLPDIENSATFAISEAGVLAHGTAQSRMETLVKRTDGAYWQILDFDFLEGRPLTEDDHVNGRRVAVITEAMRWKLFGGVPSIGRVINVDGDPFSVVGVVPDVPFSRFAAFAEVWVPIGAVASAESRRRLFGEYYGIVLARDRGDFPRLKEEFARRMKSVPMEDPRQFHVMRAGLDTPFEAAARMLLNNRMDDGAASIIRLVIAALALLFMALPALNLVTLNLSRILERASEIGVRRAFGAPRSALIRQFVTENVVLTLIGGVVAFVAASAVIPLLASLLPVAGAKFDVNLRVFGWGMLVAAFFGVLSGVYPAWRMSRLDAVTALRGGAQ